MAKKMAEITGAPFVVPSDHPSTLLEMLKKTAASVPDKGLVFIDVNGNEEQLSYISMIGEAEKFLGGIRKIGVRPGDQLIMQIHNDRKFLITFWGCILAGAVPVPIPVPQSASSEELNRFLKVFDLLEKPFVIIEERFKDVYKGIEDKVQCHIFEEICNAHRDCNWFASKANDLALLQFSSGSTGTPKGVMMTHYNIISNLIQISSALEMNIYDSTFAWIPYTHDLGLIGFHFVSMLMGNTQFKMAPEVFLKRPELWLQKLSEHRITITASPNFGLKVALGALVQGKINNIDLSSIKAMVNGAEPISVDVMEKFNMTFSRFGYDPRAMMPAYGMAEAAVGISFSPLMKPGVVHKLDRDVFSVQSRAIPCDNEKCIYFADEGYPGDGMEIRVVDENFKTLMENEIGQILIKGPNVTQGYFNLEHLNKELFVDGWLKTGDLGFVCNGRLTVTGRSKDVIFINGKNYYSHDVEAIIQQVPGIGPAVPLAVCGIHDEKAGKETVVLFIDLKSDMAEFLKIIIHIKNIVSEKIGFPIDYIIKAENMPRTNSGKIQRFKLAEEYLAGKFDDKLNEVEALLKDYDYKGREIALPETKTQYQLVEVVAGILERSPETISIDDAFIHLGGTSIKAMQALHRIEEIKNKTIGHELFIKCKTIREMGEYIDSLADEPGVNDLFTKNFNSASQYDVAIIGVAARFPKARNIDEYWDNLKNGRDSVIPVPKDRWSVNGIPNYAGCMDNIDKFDSQFFEIMPQEANHMDPQQRLFMEVVYELLEDAGAFRYLNREKSIGVFVGCSYNSYNELIASGIYNQDGKFALNQTTLVGNLLNMVAARISQMYDFNGPSMTVDTACSSSLVAVELACEAIRNGNCNMAIVGGVNVLSTASTHILFAETGALSTKGKCQVFDAEADGIAPGEGVGAILLKPLQKALEDNDRIYGVIKGVAINNDGHSLGLMAPNPKGQISVLEKAYKISGINPSTISYVEAHGTGTIIGDPVEVRALNQFFGNYCEKGQSIAIGSVKSNIGHLMAAAGMAGLIKVLLGMKYKKIPASLHLKIPNPQINFKNNCFYPVGDLKEWNTTGIPLRAGINAFGFGGTNAHLIVEEAPKAAESQETNERTLHILTLSAKTKKAVEKMSEELYDYVNKNPHIPLADIAYTRNASREHFQYRRAIIVDNMEALLNTLSNILKGTHLTNCFEGTVHRKSKGKIVFMFTGQGSQYVKMGYELYCTQPTFKRHVDECAEILKNYLPENADIRKIMFAQCNDGENAENILNQTQYCQPATFVIDYSLAKTLMDWGIKPDAVMGHSVGEYPAACIANIMSLKDGLKLIAYRGSLMQDLEQNGGMLYVEVEKETLEEYLERYKAEISVINGHTNLVVSGEKTELERLRIELEENRIICKELNVSHAFHSYLMESVLDKFLEIVKTVPMKRPEINFVSNITGQFVADEVLNPDYWSSHIRKCVLFGPSIDYLINKGYNILIETGPSKTLTSYAKKLVPKEKEVIVASTLNKYASGDWNSILENISYLWTKGVQIDWQAFDKDYSRRLVSLPSYPFEAIRHWIDETQALTFDFDKTVSEKLEENVIKGPEEEKDVSEAETTIACVNGDYEELLVNLTAEMLEINPSQIDVTENLLAMGVDSLMALRLIKRVEKTAGTTLYPTLLFEYQTIREFAEYLKNNITQVEVEDVRNNIVSLGTKELYELSNAQKRLWLLYRRNPESAFYNIPVNAVFKGSFDKEKFNSAVSLIVKRHQSFRTVFVEVAGVPKQKILEDVNFSLVYEDVSSLECEAKENYVRQKMLEDLSEAFNLEEGPLVRGIIFKLENNKHNIYINMHHIISDGWSIGVFVQELAEIYNELMANRTIQLPELPIRYVDYAAWHNELSNGNKLASQESFWMEKISKPLPVLELPSDYKRPNIQTHKGSIVNYSFEADFYKKIEKLAVKENASTFIVLLAPYIELIHNLTGDMDIIVGIPSANRSMDVLEPIIGFFVNTLCIRVNMEKIKTYKELLQEVKEACVNAFKNQDYPFDLLVEKVNPDRDPSRSPIFSTMFVMQNVPLNLTFPGFEVEQGNLMSTTSKYDILVNLLENNGTLSVNFEYDTSLFKEERIIDFVEKYKKIATMMVENPKANIHETNVLTEREKSFIEQFNNTATDYEVVETIHEMFYKQVEKTPNQIALSYYGNQMTYEELNKQSNQVAHFLRSKGIKANDLVGIMVNKSLEMIVGVIGILKAGAAYVPIDPNYPEERISYMLENSGIKILLTQERHFETIAQIQKNYGEPESIVLLDAEETSDQWRTVEGVNNFKAILEQPVHNQININHITDTVYVLYTSGSTGKPKGVMMPHKGVANLMIWEIKHYNLGTEDKQLQFSSLSFDVSFQEIFSSLLSGATLILMNDEDKVPEIIADMTEKEDITVLSFPTSFFTQMSSYVNTVDYPPEYKRLKYIFVAGEALNTQAVKDWQKVYGADKWIINAYGPTEAHVVTYYDINQPIDKEQTSITIGRPIANTRIYILNSSLQMVPVGSKGELCIAGHNVAKGYINNPDKTNEVFVQSPFLSEGENRIYKTGDLARLLPDGMLEYLGRKDYQVKIRGYRIELGEIENTIGKHPNIQDIVVNVKSDEQGINRLICYYTVKSSLEVSELRDYIRGKLPEYMMPSYFVRLDEMPLTPNRKIDRKNMPPVNMSIRMEEVEYIAPRTELEKEIAAIWSGVLKVDKIGIHDNFFSIGGDSLLVMQVMARLKKNYPNFDTKELFNTQTIYDTARLIEASESDKMKSDMEINITGENNEKIGVEEGVINTPEPHSYSFQEMNNILLTGATGFLGGYLLHDLLEDTNAKIYCIARGANEEDSRNRILENLEYLFGNEEMERFDCSRIVAIQGDLGKDYFGIDKENYISLCGLIDTVYHSAANVKHYGDHEGLIKANVVATENMLKFVQQERIKILNYVSTVGVCGLKAKGPDNIFRETDFYEDAELPNMYEKTKHLAEKTVRGEMNKGYPIRIFRIGFIMGDSRNGKFKKDIAQDAMYRFIKASIQMGVVPYSNSDLIELAPVDYCSRSIVLISKKPESLGNAMHICNPQPIGRNQLWKYIMEYGYNLAVLDSEFYRNNVYKMSDDPEYMDGLQKIIVYLEDFYDLSIKYDTSNTEKFLYGSGISCPAIDYDLIKVYLDYCISTGYLKTPEEVNTIGITQYLSEVASAKEIFIELE